MPAHLREWWPDEAEFWSAVGDPTQRRMLDLLLTDGGGTATTVSELARAVAQLSSVGTTWDARLRRLKRSAEAIQRSREG